MLGDIAAEAVIAPSATMKTADCEGVSVPHQFSETRISVLFVDDLDADAERVRAALAACRDIEVEVQHVTDPDEARRLWDARVHDVAIFDIWLGRGTSVELLEAFALDDTGRPLVVLSSLPDAEACAIGGNARDFLVHSKQRLTSTALAMTLGSALALSRRRAVMLAA